MTDMTSPVKFVFLANTAITIVLYATGFPWEFNGWCSVMLAVGVK